MATVRFHKVGGAVQACKGCSRCSSPERIVPEPEPEVRPSYMDSLAYRSLRPASVPMPEVCRVIQCADDFEASLALSVDIWGRRWQKRPSGVGQVIGPSEDGGYVGNPSSWLVPNALRRTAAEMNRHDAPALLDRDAERRPAPPKGARGMITENGVLRPWTPDEVRD